MSKKADTPSVADVPQRPLKYRIPNEGPSPREYELLAIHAKRALTEAEAAELRAEQDTRTEWDAAWAKYHEDMRAYHAAQARMNANA
jgi:hypothetical protein